VDSKTNNEVLKPKKVLLEKVKQIACGFEHSLFVNQNGELFGNGNNENGCLIKSSGQDVIQTPTLI
jgi:alpha-tubulin suppressor-like RCC1 family protein